MALRVHERTGRAHERTGREMMRRNDAFDRLFDDPWNVFHRPLLAWPDDGLTMRVEEYREGGSLVIRAELAGVDPERDIEISLGDGVLHLEVERRTEEETEEREYVRSEFRYGSYSRDLPLPRGASEGDIKATYEDGILEVRVPIREAKPAVKVPVTKA